MYDVRVAGKVIYHQTWHNMVTRVHRDVKTMPMVMPRMSNNATSVHGDV